MSSSDRGDLPAELIDQAVDRILGAGPANRDTVQRDLLASHPHHERALQRLFAELSGTEQLLEASFVDDDPEMPQTLGGHRVLRHLGEGAFGVVHLCEQERPVKRTVAVKVLRPGAGDRHTLRRFEAERQLLASLNHSAITQIFDAGHLPDGRPYFVMEYVDGQPITVYCERKHLTCAQRLRLFVDLCRGIEHAHARGIVHRDLKPGNVLVVDGVPAPQPKIIDFGIAKALDAPAADDLVGHGNTDPGRVIGTPGYMSPEQADGQGHEVDARADVFALGVMLYELLTGELPWTHDETATARDPVIPSARVTTKNSRALHLSPASPRRLAALLRGDLDWITLKALARERERRYQSVRELIDDLERHRDGLPVLAGPPSVSYRLAKFVRRNRTTVLAAGGALLVSALVLAIASSFTRDANEARAQARTEAASSWKDATAAAEQLLTRASDESLGRLPRSDAVRQMLLQDALGFYDKWLAERPTDHRLQEPRCRTLLLLSRVHWQIGQLPDAQRRADEARSIAATLHAANPQDVEMRALLADALRKLGIAIASAGRPADALPLFVDASQHLDACFHIAPARHGLSYSSALREVAMMQQVLQRPDESLASFGASLRVLESMLPSAPVDATVHRDVVIAGVGLAQQFLLAGRLDDAERPLIQAELRLPAVTVDRHRTTAMVQGLLGELALQRRDPSAAIPRITAALRAAEQWRLEEPQQLMPHELNYQSARRLGAVHEQLGAWSDATAAYLSSIAIADAMVEQFRDDPMRLVVLVSTLTDLSRVLWDRFRLTDLEQADAWARRALASSTQIPESVDVRRRRTTWQYELMVARIDDGRGRPADALWEQIAAGLARATEPDAAGPAQVRAEAWVGVARNRLSRHLLAECEAALAEPRRMLAADERSTGHWVLEIARTEAQLAQARGDHVAMAAAADRMFAAGSSWSGKWRAAEALCGAWRCADERSDAEPRSGTAYCDRAERLVHEVIKSLENDVQENPDDPWVVVPWGFSHLLMAEIEAARGDRDAARRELATGLPALQRVESNTPRDYWNDVAWRAAKALEQSLAASFPR